MDPTIPTQKESSVRFNKYIGRNNTSQTDVSSIGIVIALTNYALFQIQRIQQQCSRKAYVVLEPGDAPSGCPGCDIVFNARFEFWEDGCGLLSEEIWNNGLYAPFGLRGDQEFLYYQGQWLEQDISSSQRERRWRSYSSLNGYWETYTSGPESVSFFITSILM